LLLGPVCIGLYIVLTRRAW